MPGRGSPPDTMEYYNLLGVPRDADSQQIKKRLLVKKDYERTS